MRIHFWDDFVARQLDRLKTSCNEADIYVLASEANSHVPGIEHDKVFRVREDQMPALGLGSESPDGALFWYNGDYPMYAFLAAHPEYSHYLFVEFDVVLNLDVDRFVRHALRIGDDIVSHFPTAPIENWYWAKSHAPLYSMDVLKQVLFSVCLISHGALQFLFDRRRALSDQFHLGQTTVIPYCEAFIATELAQAGYRLGNLSDYGDVSHLDWWPPWREAHLDRMPRESFLHPVLDDPRYVKSVLKYSPLSFFRPGSIVNAKLRIMPPHAYVPALSAGVMQQLRQKASRSALTPRGRRSPPSV
jgi:hypothetical protein